MEKTKIFSVFGNQGQDWKQAAISIFGSSFNSQYTIRIVGKTASYLSDIAIDDVTISSGLCSLEGMLCMERSTRH